MRAARAASLAPVLLLLPLLAPLGAEAASAVATPNPQLDASAGTYYVTEIGHGAIARVTVSPNGASRVDASFVTGLPESGPDSAVFAADGTLLVSNFNDGSIARVDVATGRVTTARVNRTALTPVADLAADPGSDSVVAILWNTSGPDAVSRVDLGSGQTTPLNPDHVGSVGGIAFNADGSRLFVSSRQGSIAELNPQTGRVIRQAKVPGSPDGLTYDPTTGDLYASGCVGICRLDTGGTGTATLRLLNVLASVDGDGLAADGKGHVYVAEGSCGSLCRLDVASDTTVLVADGIPGADDVTPVSGAGSATGTVCLTVRSCFTGAGGAGLAAAATALIIFVGSAGYLVIRRELPVPARPAPTAAHAHLAARGGAPAAAGGAGGAAPPAASQQPPAPPPPPPPPAPPAPAGGEVAGIGPGQVVSETGSKLLDAALEVAPEAAAGGLVGEVGAEAAGAEDGGAGLPGGARSARDEEDEPGVD